MRIFLFAVRLNKILRIGKRRKNSIHMLRTVRYEEENFIL